jgi:hypothetical protein
VAGTPFGVQFEEFVHWVFCDPFHRKFIARVFVLKNIDTTIDRNLIILIRLGLLG